MSNPRVDGITVKSLTFDTNIVYTPCVWTSRLQSGSNSLFRENVRNQFSDTSGPTELF